MEHEMYGLAEEMIGKELPYELRCRIKRVIELVEDYSGQPDGTLRSTQVLATMVEQWERDEREAL